MCILLCVNVLGHSSVGLQINAATINHESMLWKEKEIDFYWRNPKRLLKMRERKVERGKIL